MLTRERAAASEAADQEPRRAWRIVTPEYPPQTGGVSDYTALLAAELRHQGDSVEVWCPAVPLVSGDKNVNHVRGGMGPAGLFRMQQAMNAAPAADTLLIQWVPHGYGWRSMNLPFCLWVWLRSRRESVQIMVHEPFLAFGEGTWKQNVAASVHRVMLTFVLRGAEIVWVSIPLWGLKLRPFLPQRAVPVRWLPVTSNIEVSQDAAAVSRLRERLVPGREVLAGHFGTHGPLVTRLLDRLVPELARLEPSLRFVFIGQSSDQYAESLQARHSELRGRVFATGIADSHTVSETLQACDLALQPFADGVSTRRCSAIAALAHGLPVVTSSGVATESLWAESGAAVLAPAGDDAAFVRAARELVSQPALRGVRGRAARRLFRERFSISSIAQQLREGVHA